MVEIDGIIYRNLQEQVQKNMEDIQELQESGSGTPADYDTVKAQVTTNKNNIITLTAQVTANTNDISSAKTQISNLNTKDNQLQTAINSEADARVASYTDLNNRKQNKISVHYITIHSSDSREWINFQVITTDSEVFTYSTLRAWLYNNKFRKGEQLLPATGRLEDDTFSCLGVDGETSVYVDALAMGVCATAEEDDQILVAYAIQDEDAKTKISYIDMSTGNNFTDTVITL